MHRRIFGPLLVLAFAASACGPDDSSTGRDDASPGTGDASPENLCSKAYRCDPAKVEANCEQSVENEMMLAELVGCGSEVQAYNNCVYRLACDDYMNNARARCSSEADKRDACRDR